MKIQLFFIFQFLFCLNAAKGQLPGTDIWLVDISSVPDSSLKIKTSNITNRPGYDNQPAFSPDGSFLLYTSVRDDHKAHIYRYDFKNGNIIPFTITNTSEYSPAFIPDGKNISVVKVEADSTQRLWKFPLAGGDPSLIVSTIDSVGYHGWINKDNLILNIITKPATLYCVKLPEKRIIQNWKIDVGRCFQPYRKGILLTAKTDSVRMIYYLNEKKKLTPLAKCLEGSEDFCLWNKNTIIMAKGHSLFKYDIEKNKEWELFAILSGNITRLAVSPDGKKLAVVISE